MAENYSMHYATWRVQFLIGPQCFWAAAFPRAEQQLVVVVSWHRAYFLRTACVGGRPLRVVVWSSPSSGCRLETDEVKKQSCVCRDLLDFIFLLVGSAMFSCSGCFLRHDLISSVFYLDHASFQVCFFPPSHHFYVSNFSGFFFTFLSTCMLYIYISTIFKGAVHPKTKKSLCTLHDVEDTVDRKKTRQNFLHNWFSELIILSNLTDKSQNTHWYIMQKFTFHSFLTHHLIVMEGFACPNDLGAQLSPRRWKSGSPCLS